jgi:cell wall-associated NlpC family hydrolase
MSNPRLIPDQARITTREPASVIVPVADLNRTEVGPRDRQLIYGDAVTVLHRSPEWCYIQAEKDGYCGFVSSNALGSPQTATHHITAAASHVYTKPDFKSPDRTSLTFSSKITVLSTHERFAETSLGFIPIQHISPLDVTASDPAAIAALFIGTPYLWGGNSRWGIDCSGLAQTALLACATPCLGDSDQQQTIGTAAQGAYERNDLLFWKGHVALVTDPKTLIHANANSMSTRYESIESAIQRIKASGDGPVTAHRRL